MDIQLSTIFSVLGAAIFTGLLTLVGLIISKENKTSEFRQQWIDSLRSEVSDLVGHFEVVLTNSELFVEKVKHKVGASISKEQTEYLEMTQETIQKIHSLHRKIFLRLNPVEHIEICKILSEIEATYDSMPYFDRKKLHPLISRLVNATQTELKNGWEQVKAGEPVFQKAKKYVSIGLIVFGVGIILIGIVSAFMPKPSKSASSPVKQVQSQITSCKAPVINTQGKPTSAKRNIPTVSK